MTASLLSFCHYLKSGSVFCDVELLCISQCLTVNFVCALQQEQKDPHHHPQIPSWWQLWGLGLWWAHHHWLNNLSSMHWQNDAGSHQPAAQVSKLHKTQKTPETDTTITLLSTPQFDSQTPITSGECVSRWNNEYMACTLLTLEDTSKSKQCLYNCAIWQLTWSVSWCRWMSHNEG